MSRQPKPAVGKRATANSGGRGKAVNRETQADKEKKLKDGLYINAKIGEVEMEFLLDTGASECFMSYRQYKSLAAKVMLPELRQANGTPLQVKGRMTIDLELGEQTFPAEVLVGGIQGDAILGLGFLIAVGHQLDFEKMQLRRGCHVLQCHETMMVPAGGEMILKGEVKGCRGDSREYLGLVEPADRNSALEEKQLMIARALVKVGGEVPVRVCNLGAEPLLVYKDTLSKS